MCLDVCLVSLTGSWRVPMFVVVVTLIIVGSQEKPPTPGKGKYFHLHAPNAPQNKVYLLHISELVVSC